MRLLALSHDRLLSSCSIRCFGPALDELAVWRSLEDSRCIFIKLATLDWMTIGQNIQRLRPIELKQCQDGSHDIVDVNEVEKAFSDRYRALFSQSSDQWNAARTVDACQTQRYSATIWQVLSNPLLGGQSQLWTGPRWRALRTFIDPATIALMVNTCGTSVR